MIIRFRTTLVSVVVAAAVAAPAMLRAQVSLDIPLVVTDHGDGSVPGRDTLYFGVNPTATNGRDAALGEEEQPPAPPEGVFDARWVNVGSSNSFGQGVKRNYRAFMSGDQTDTFRLKVQPGFKQGSSGYPVMLSWPSLTDKFDAASLRFVDGDGNPSTQDMLAATSFSFSNASATVSTVTIVTSRPKSTSGVTIAEATLNLKLSSAPNPVHRGEGASLSYTLPVPARVALTVYNALGEQMGVMADERQTSGRHVVNVATSMLPVGSYFAVITADKLTMACRFVVVE